MTHIRFDMDPIPDGQIKEWLERQLRRISIAIEQMDAEMEARSASLSAVTQLTVTQGESLSAVIAQSDVLSASLAAEISRTDTLSSSLAAVISHAESISANIAIQQGATGGGSATAGGFQTIPTVEGFVTATFNGTEYVVPYFKKKGS